MKYLMFKNNVCLKKSLTCLCLSVYILQLSPVARCYLHLDVCITLQNVSFYVCLKLHKQKDKTAHFEMNLCYISVLQKHCYTKKYI